jgi:hypothetical protein
MPKYAVTLFSLGRILILMGLSAGQVSADLIVNGSFENPALRPGSWQVFSSIPGWTSPTVGAGIEIQNNVAGSPYDGNQHVELDSNFNSLMTQNIQTTNGQSYALSFAYSPRPGVSDNSNGIEVWWNNVLLGTITASGVGLSNTNWQLYTYTISGTGNDTLQFVAVGISESYGGYIDAVSLNTTATPLPAAAWLLGSGLLGLVGIRRKIKS